MERVVGGVGDEGGFEGVEDLRGVWMGLQEVVGGGV